MWGFCTTEVPINPETVMAQANTHADHRKEYFIVFFLLALFTVVELYIPELSLSKFAKGSALVAVAIIKAFLVAYFYMHLKDEKAWLKFIACIPLSAALFAAAVILESLYR